VALDADTKLVPCFHVGKRDAENATLFMRDLVSRLANRVQLTTDGHRMYITAVEEAFKWNGVDYAMLWKIYETPPRESTQRYSPSKCVGTERRWMMGSPDEAHVSTSYVERSNLTMRMSQRRFTRLTNAFSKKLENLKHAVALHFFHYNFCRLHMTTRITPAMAAGVDPHLWTLEELAEMAEQNSESPN
jgi:IS1 family transposase